MKYRVELGIKNMEKKREKKHILDIFWVMCTGTP